STIAPVKSAGGVAVSALRSACGIIQLPSPSCVPPWSVQPDGRLAMLTLTMELPALAGAASPRLMGLPAAPAGAVVLRACVLPALRQSARCEAPDAAGVSRDRDEGSRAFLKRDHRIGVARAGKRRVAGDMVGRRRTGVAAEVFGHRRRYRIHSKDE